MDRLTKIVVLAWICAAIVCQVWVQKPGWPALPLITAVVAAASIALGFLERRAIAFVLAVSYLFPVLIRTYLRGSPYAPNEVVWTTAVVGVMLPSAARSAWHIPVRWRGALVAAALVAVVTAPIVCLREMDLNPGLLRDLRGWSFGGGLWPSLPVTWSLYSSLTLVVGVVWFDWLFSLSAADFRRSVVVPFAASASVLTAVLVYQLFVDVTFVNDTVFGTIGRAAGTMYDANLSGTVAAMWLGGLLVLAFGAGKYVVPLTTLVMLANWLAVWASGSRTAFMAAFTVTTAAVIGILARRGTPGTRTLSVGAALVGTIAVFAILVSLANPRIGAPLRRVWATLPSPSLSSARDFAAEMWNRNGYGTGAVAMLKDSPFFGIGVGTFQSTIGDYAGGLPPDNAQNWLRHQIAEFGLIGSLGWTIWLVLFAAFLLHVRRSDDARVWIARGVLIGFGMISFLGVPGQDVIVTITFWTMAYWYVTLVGAPAASTATPRWMAAAAVLVAVVAGAGTAQLAMTRLRVPERAMRHTWPYSYGFASAQAVAGEEGYHRSRSHSVAVLDIPSRWLSVSVRSDPHAGDPPVDVRVWADGRTVLKAQLTTTGPLTAIVPLPAGSTRVLLEAAGRRLGSTRPFFVRSPEALYFLKWEFLDRPPANFNGAGYPKPISS